MAGTLHVSNLTAVCIINYHYMQCLDKVVYLLFLIILYDQKCFHSVNYCNISFRKVLKKMCQAKEFCLVKKYHSTSSVLHMAVAKSLLPAKFASREKVDH